jgi:hypothetical protein
MTEETDILTRYREADANERLYLFLQYIEYRISFQDIELEEYTAQKNDIGIFDQAA